MSETTATIHIIHDTVRLAHETHGWAWQDVAKTVTAIITGIGALIGGWRYLGHRRLKAHEEAIINTTTASAEADAKVIAAEADADVTLHRSRTEIILYWEKRVKELEYQNNLLMGSLALLQSQAAAGESGKQLAEARLQAAKEKITTLEEELQRFKDRIEEQKEYLAELPALRNQVQSLQAKCELLQNELQHTIELVQS